LSMTFRPLLFARTLALLLAGALLTSCIYFDRSVIAEPTKPSRSLSQRPCCDSLLEIEVYPLPINEYLTTVVDRNDSVLEFRTGKSFAKAFELPKIEQEYVIQLDSVVNTPRLDLSREAIYPMVTLLDANLNTVAIFDNEQVDLRKPFFGPDLLRIILTVEQGSKARYALIHTSAEITDKGISVDKPYKIAQEKNFDSILYERSALSRKKIHFAETGMINILVYTK